MFSVSRIFKALSTLLPAFTPQTDKADTKITLVDSAFATASVSLEMKSPARPDEFKETKFAPVCINKNVKLSLSKTLASGGYAIVGEGTWNGQPAALKFQTKSVNNFALGTREFEEEVLADANFLNTLASTGAAIGCYGVTYAKVNLNGHEHTLPCFGLELASEGDLFGIASEGKMSTLENLDILRKVARKLSVLHANFVVHGDIKPDNVLKLGSDYRFTDFQYSIVLSASEKSRILPKSYGTSGYRSPELFKHRIFSCESDIYAFGGLMFNMLEKQDIKDYKQKLRFKFTPLEVLALIRRCWETDPSIRPSATDLANALDISYESLKTAMGR